MPESSMPCVHARGGRTTRGRDGEVATCQSAAQLSQEFSIHGYGCARKFAV